MQAHLPSLCQSHQPDVVIANGENIAGGAGLTIDTCRDMFSLGVDVLTTGNHVWDRREIINYIDSEPRLLRPLNFPEGTPGNGWVILEEYDLLVLNVQGRVFMRSLDDPFRGVDRILQRFRPRFVFVDFHAEATAEKKAMAFYLDGRVSAVIGTHTHVATADEQVLPGGTAFLSDVGMTGPILSIIGNDPESSLPRYLTQMPGRSLPAKGNAELNAALLSLDPITGKATSIERINRRWPKSDQIVP